MIMEAMRLLSLSYFEIYNTEYGNKTLLEYCKNDVEKANELAEGTANSKRSVEKEISTLNWRIALFLNHSARASSQ